MFQDGLELFCLQQISDARQQKNKTKSLQDIACDCEAYLTQQGYMKPYPDKEI